MDEPRAQPGGRKSKRAPGAAARKGVPHRKPPLRVFTTTLWEYPSQHYGSEIQGDKNYTGATPSWVIWQLLSRYTREGDLIVDPMCGSGTTLDVARDLQRKALGYDLGPTRPDIIRADARELPLEDASADFLFIDPPYSTHIEYSDDPRCIGKLDAGGEEGGGDGGAAYYEAMARVIAECHRVLKDRRYMGLYVSDSFKKGRPFMPIGFELFSIMRERFKPVDIVCVARQNAKLARGNWKRAAEEGNFFLRGFNYLFIMKKEEGTREARTAAHAHAERSPKPGRDPRPKRPRRGQSG